MYVNFCQEKDAHVSSYHQLSQQERYTITALLISRRSHAEIARTLESFTQHHLSGAFT